MKLTKHQLDIVSTAVGAIGNHSSLVNSQAATVHTYPGLPPVAELKPGREDMPRQHDTDMPNDSQPCVVIDVVKKLCDE